MARLPVPGCSVRVGGAGADVFRRQAKTLAAADMGEAVAGAEAVRRYLQQLQGFTPDSDCSDEVGGQLSCRCLCRCFPLPCPALQGLAPGTHRFKYVVDGCWVIDLAAHTEADSRGNINNVVQVRERGARPAQLEAGDDPAASGAAVATGSSEGTRGGGSAPAPAPIVGGPAGTVGASGIRPILITSPPEVPVEPRPGEEDPQQQQQQQQQEGADEEGDVPTRLQRAPRPWRDDAELERMARFGGAVLAFHTRLGVQLRHVLH